MPGTGGSLNLISSKYPSPAVFDSENFQIPGSKGITKIKCPTPHWKENLKRCLNRSPNPGYLLATDKILRKLWSRNQLK
jgi:hypothetical protein